MPQSVGHSPGHGDLRPPPSQGEREPDPLPAVPARTRADHLQRYEVMPLVVPPVVEEQA